MEDIGVVMAPTGLATVYHHPKQLVLGALFFVLYVIINDLAYITYINTINTIIYVNHLLITYIFLYIF